MENAGFLLISDQFFTPTKHCCSCSCGRLSQGTERGCITCQVLFFQHDIRPNIKHLILLQKLKEVENLFSSEYPGPLMGTDRIIRILTSYLSILLFFSIFDINDIN